MSDTREEEVQHSETEEHSSTGSFILLLFYLVVIVGLWGTVYLTLLSRG